MASKIHVFFHFCIIFFFFLVTNLRFITTLLSYKSVDKILAILKQHQSILVRSFNNILDEIEVGGYLSMTLLLLLFNLRISYKIINTILTIFFFFF